MGNTASNYTVIRVAPTLDTSAYADNDVFFNATAIPNAVIGNGGCSKLIGLSILNEDDVAHDFDIIFMQKETDLGTINDAVASGSKWTNVLAKAAGVLGVVKIDWSDNSVNLVNNLVYTAIGGDRPSDGEAFPILLQSEDNSSSVYMEAVSRGGTPTVEADDYEFAFYIER